MKINFMKKIIAIAAAAFLANTASAQDLYSGYFSQGYVYRHELNPAFEGTKSYIAFPAIGNINIAERGNLALSSLIYKRDGRTVTWMNKDVSTAEFLGNIADDNKLNENLKLQLLAWGFKAFKGYNTVGINIRQNMSANIPDEMLRLTKEGLTNKTYQIKDMNAHLDAYAELELGHSHQISKQWRVGGKLKVLMGLANIDAHFNNVTLDLGETAYNISADADVQSNVKSIEYKYDVNENTKKQYVDGISSVKPGISGYGLAVDLGTEFRLNDNWDFSLAVNDIGFLSFGKTYSLNSNPNNVFTTKKYIFSADKNDVNNFDDELSRLGDDFAELYQLEDKGDIGGRTTTLGATLNVGAEYTCAFYNKLSFGLLSTTRFQGKNTWTDCRLSANIAPWRAFSAGINCAVGTYGTSFGWQANLHHRGLGFYLGMDHTMGKLTKQLLPLSSNTEVSLGFYVCY